MASNKDKDEGSKGTRGGTPEQHAEAGRQSHKGDTSRQSDTSGTTSAGGRAGSGGSAGQDEAHRQGRKDQGSSQSGGGGSGSGSGGGTRGGTPEQHAEAGRQSHKNDDRS